MVIVIESLCVTIVKIQTDLINLDTDAHKWIYTIDS